MGGIGLALVLAFANANEGQSQDIVNGYERQVVDIAGKPTEAIEAFAYMEQPLTIQEMQINRVNRTLAAGDESPLHIIGLFEGDREMYIGNHQAMVYTSSNNHIARVEDGRLLIADTAVTGDNVTITCTYQHMSQDIHISIKQSLEDTIRLNNEGKRVVTNKTALDVLVNKKRGLPSDYVPDGLVEPDVPFSFSGQDEKRNLRPIAASALEEMFKGAKEEGLHLVAVSGYRSYRRQTFLHNYKIRKYGLEATKRVSAIPGHSEHQTGLAMDISCRSVRNKLVRSFGETSEGIWLSENAHKYGFIIRYPNGKEDVTGYVYEPWHVRYLGVNLATKVYESGLTYEEYLATE